MRGGGGEVMAGSTGKRGGAAGGCAVVAKLKQAWVIVIKTLCHVCRYITVAK